MIVGSMLLLLGIAGLFMPVMPGWLLIIPGLAILARDFSWAERLHLGLKDRFDRARGVFEHRNEDSRSERDAA